MTKTRSNAPKIVFLVFLAALLIYGALASLAYGFSANGGEIAIASHTVEIDAATDGNVVTVVGNRNTVQQQRPYEPAPESEQHQRGELAFLTLLLASGLGAIWYWWLRVRNGFEFIMVSQKEPKQ
jgi:hypothetical protein